MDILNRNQLRKKILAARDQLSPVKQIKKSARITEKLLTIKKVQKAGIFFVYMNFRSEVQTMDMINNCLNQGKIITIPLTQVNRLGLLAVRITDPQRQVKPGYCSIPEPDSSLLPGAVFAPGMIEVVIVPGSVFDRSGGRLGYGGGYYDRFLDQEAHEALRIGLAYNLQLVEQVPVEPHDQFMDFIVTERKIYDCRRTRHAQDGRLP